MKPNMKPTIFHRPHFSATFFGLSIDRLEEDLAALE
jgi:hypothetical protein